jgi:hypothetical protein
MQGGEWRVRLRLIVLGARASVPCDRERETVAESRHEKLRYCNPMRPGNSSNIQTFLIPQNGCL